MKSISRRITERFKVNEASADVKSVESAIKDANNLMGVGAELKKAGIKYDFSAGNAPMPPMYTLKIGTDNYAILNKSYVSGADFVHGEIAMGKM